MRTLLALTASVLFLARPLAPVQQPAGAQPSSLAFTHATVIDVAAKDPARALKPDQTVVVTGDHIVAVERAPRIPPGAVIVDASGKYLIPGLWDMHVHSLTDGRYNYFFPLLLANGVTTVREMGNNLPPEETARLREEIAAGTRLGPRFAALTGRILDGPGTRPPAFQIVASPDEGRAFVASAKRQHADFVKVYDLLPRDVYLAVVDEAKKQGLPVAGHTPFAMTAAEVSDLGQKSIEHTTDVLISSSRDEADLRTQLAAPGPTGPHTERNRVEIKAIDGYDEQKAAALFARFVRNGTWQCPTVIVRRPTIFSEIGQLTSDDRMKYVAPAVRANWSNTFTRGVLAMADLEQRRKRFQKTLDVVAAMHRAGVGILAGTDSMVPFVFAGFALHDELGLLVQAGLTPMDALRTATVNPAAFLGRSASMGTVDKGKLADLVLLEANPLDDIANTRKIAAVVANGRYLAKADLQKLLSDVEAIANAK